MELFPNDTNGFEVRSSVRGEQDGQGSHIRLALTSDIPLTHSGSSAVPSRMQLRSREGPAVAPPAPGDHCGPCAAGSLSASPLTALP